MRLNCWALATNGRIVRSKYLLLLSSLPGACADASSRPEAYALSDCEIGPSDQTNFQRSALYLDRQRATGVEFGEKLILGTMIRSRSFGQLMGWEADISDCSNAQYRCLSADRFQFFVPRRSGEISGPYRHRDYVLTELGCDRDAACSFKIEYAGSSLTQSPLDVYFRQSSLGIISIGFGGGDSREVSRRFRLVGPVGLFGPSCVQREPS